MGKERRKKNFEKEKKMARKFYPGRGF